MSASSHEEVQNLVIFKEPSDVQINLRCVTNVFKDQWLQAMS